MLERAWKPVQVRGNELFVGEILQRCRRQEFSELFWVGFYHRDLSGAEAPQLLVENHSHFYMKIR